MINIDVPFMIDIDACPSNYQFIYYGINIRIPLDNRGSSSILRVNIICKTEKYLSSALRTVEQRVVAWGVPKSSKTNKLKNMQIVLSNIILSTMESKILRSLDINFHESVSFRKFSLHEECPFVLHSQIQSSGSFRSSV